MFGYIEQKHTDLLNPTLSYLAMKENAVGLQGQLPLSQGLSELNTGLTESRRAVTANASFEKAIAGQANLVSGFSSN